MPRSLARLALWLTATIAVIASPRVQAEAPFDFMPISTPIQNDLRITWSSALGCKDTFEKSTELGTWVPLAGPYYGIGQQFQVTVLDAFAPAPNQNPPPAVWSQFVSFSLTKYSGGVIASWLGDGGRPCNQLLPSGWSSLVLPLLYSFERTSVQPPHVLCLSSSVAPPGSMPPPNSSLSAAESATLAKLTGAYQEVVDRLAQFPNPPSDGGTQSGTFSETGKRAMYRVRREAPDSDLDGLTDYQELTWNRTSA